MPPYNPEWDELTPQSVEQFIARAAKANITVHLCESNTIPKVQYLLRMEDGRPRDWGVGAHRCQRLPDNITLSCCA